MEGEHNQEDASEHMLYALSQLRLSEAPDNHERQTYDNIVQLYVWEKLNEHRLTKLERENFIPEFDRIEFDEPLHLYTVEGLIHRDSMTSVMHSFFGHFDAEATIARIVSSQRWRSDPSYKYYQMSSQAIAKEWKDNGSDASFRGTVFHAHIEFFYNAMTHALFNERANLGEEYVCFELFYQLEAKDVLRPFRTELRVYDMDYEICGSVDMLYWAPPELCKCRKKTGKCVCLVMYDWKRSKEIKDRAFDPNDFGMGPVHSMPNANKYHYYCQLNGYKFLIEKLTKYRVVEMYLGVFHPNHATEKSRQQRARRDNLSLIEVPPYLKIRVPLYQEQVRVIFELRRYNLIVRDVRHLRKKFDTLADQYEQRPDEWQCPEMACAEFLDHWHHFYRLAIRATRAVTEQQFEKKHTLEQAIESTNELFLRWTASIHCRSFVSVSVEQAVFDELCSVFEQRVAKQCTEMIKVLSYRSLTYAAYNPDGLGIPPRHEGERCKGCFCCDYCARRFDQKVHGNFSLKQNKGRAY